VSHHLLRLTPRHLARQSRLTHELTISPNAATINHHRDYFGNPTHFIGVETPHKRLVIHSRSRVAVSPPFIPEPIETRAGKRPLALPR